MRLSLLILLMLTAGCVPSEEMPDAAPTSDASMSDGAIADSAGPDTGDAARSPIPSFLNGRVTMDEWPSVLASGCVLTIEGAPAGAPIGYHRFLDDRRDSVDTMRILYLEGSLSGLTQVDFCSNGEVEFTRYLSREYDEAGHVVRTVTRAGPEEMYAQRSERLYEPAVNWDAVVHSDIPTVAFLAAPNSARTITTSGPGTDERALNLEYDEEGVLTRYAVVENGEPAYVDDLSVVRSVNADGSTEVRWKSGRRSNEYVAILSPEGELTRFEGYTDTPSDGILGDRVSLRDGRPYEGDGVFTVADERTPYRTLFFDAP